jgi:hypothetical protein
MGNGACRGVMAVIVDSGRRSQRSDWTVRRPDPAIERQDQGSPALVHVHHVTEPLHPINPRRKMDDVCDIRLVLNGTRGRQEGSSIVRTDRLPCNIRTGVPIATEKKTTIFLASRSRKRPDSGRRPFPPALARPMKSIDPPLRNDRHVPATSSPTPSSPAPIPEGVAVLRNTAHRAWAETPETGPGQQNGSGPLGLPIATEKKQRSSRQAVLANDWIRDDGPFRLLWQGR